MGPSSSSLCRCATGSAAPSSRVNARFADVSSNSSMRSSSGVKTLVTPEPRSSNSMPAAATSASDRTRKAMWFRIDPSVPPDDSPSSSSTKHVRKGHHDSVADLRGVAAERHPERGVRLDVAHHVVQVPHGHPGVVSERRPVRRQAKRLRRTTERTQTQRLVVSAWFRPLGRLDRSATSGRERQSATATGSRRPRWGSTRPSRRSPAGLGRSSSRPGAGRPRPVRGLSSSV